MKCDQCQTENKEGAKFCAKCGTGLSVMPAKSTAEVRQCPDCGKELKLDAKFCGGCGHKFEQTVAVQEPKVEIAVAQPEVMPIKPEVKIVSPAQIAEQGRQEPVIESTKPCPKCGKALKLDAKFCGGCGHNFAQSVAVPASSVDAPTMQPEFKQTPLEIKANPPKKIVEQIKPKFIPEIAREKKSGKKLDIPTRKGSPIAVIAGGISLVIAIIAGGGIYYYKSHTGQNVAAKPEQKPIAAIPQQASTPVPVAAPVTPPSSIPASSPVPVSAPTPISTPSPVVPPVVEPVALPATPVASRPKKPVVHAKQKGETQDDKKLLNAIDQYMDKQK